MVAYWTGGLVPPPGRIKKLFKLPNVFLQSKTSFPHLSLLPGKPNWSDWNHFCTIFFEYYADCKNNIFYDFCHTSFFSKNIFFCFFRFSKNCMKSRKISPRVWCNPFWIRLGNKEVIAFLKRKSACHTPWFFKNYFSFFLIFIPDSDAHT